MAKKTLLHEIVAIEADVKGQAARIEAEALDTFVKKQNLFDGKTRTYKARTEGGAFKEAEYNPVQETVLKKLAWVVEAQVRNVDLLVTKETANLRAAADIIINDVIIAANVPVTALVNLENKFKRFRVLLESAPTLNPTKDWKSTPEGIWETAPAVTTSIEKEEAFLTVSAATDKHPAQVQKILKDFPAGDWTLTEKSGRITSAKKADLIGKCDEMIRALKTARERANNIEVDQAKIGENLFKHIIG